MERYVLLWKKDFNKPSKEELARQIARNMAIKNGEEIFF